MFEKLRALEGVMEVGTVNVLRVETFVDSDRMSNGLRREIHEEEQRIIDAHPDIVFDFRIRQCYGEPK